MHRWGQQETEAWISWRVGCGKHIAPDEQATALIVAEPLGQRSGFIIFERVTGAGASLEKCRTADNGAQQQRTHIYIYMSKSVFHSNPHGCDGEHRGLPLGYVKSDLVPGYIPTITRPRACWGSICRRIGEPPVHYFVSSRRDARVIRRR